MRKWLMRILCALVLTGVASVACATYPLYLQVDGRWYWVGAGESPQFGYGTLTSTTVHMSGCHRPGYAPMGTGGIWMFYGASWDLLSGISTMQWHAVKNHPASRVIVMRTNAGDIVCNGEIPSPVTGSYFVDLIFADGFGP